MSKARLVITAVTVEKRSVSEVAKSYGVARSWICTLLDRYRDEASRRSSRGRGGRRPPRRRSATTRPT
jgi:transposase